MPLLPGKANIGKNIKTEQSAGKPHDQAVAIALSVERKGKARKAKFSRKGRSDELGDKD